LLLGVPLKLLIIMIRPRGATRLNGGIKNHNTRLAEVTAFEDLMPT